MGSIPVQLGPNVFCLFLLGGGGGGGGDLLYSLSTFYTWDVFCNMRGSCDVCLELVALVCTTY